METTPVTHTTIRIRESLPDDNTALHELITSTLHERLGDVLPSQDVHNCAMLYHGRCDSQRCLVAEVDHRLVGYALACAKRNNGLAHTTGLIERLYVRDAIFSESEARSVASSLIVALCANRRSLDPSAAADTAIAFALYDRWGFVDPYVFRLCLSMPSGEGRVLRGAGEELAAVLGD